MNFMGGKKVVPGRIKKTYECNIYCTVRNLIVRYKT
jgi:hypothetical protein